MNKTYNTPEVEALVFQTDCMTQPNSQINTNKTDGTGGNAPQRI